jgi:hypothetical protein
MYSLRRLRKNNAASSTDASTDKKSMLNHGAMSIWSTAGESRTSINLHDEATLERELHRAEKKLSHAGVCSSWASWFVAKHPPPHLSTDDGLTKNDPLSPTMLMNDEQPIIHQSRFEAMVAHYSNAIDAPMVSSRNNTPTFRDVLDDAPETSSSQLMIKKDGVKEVTKPKKQYYVDTKEALTEEESGDDETAAETPSPPSTGRSYLNRFRHGQWV